MKLLAPYGTGLASLLRKHGIEVFDVNRPDRTKRRHQGRSGPTDAESAARAVLSCRATAIAKTQSGAAEMMRVVSVARCSGVKAKTQAINQLRALLVSAPPRMFVNDSGKASPLTVQGDAHERGHWVLLNS